MATSWDDPAPPLVEGKAGEPDDHRIARTLQPLLGRLNGTIEDQWITVTRHHVGDIVIWLGERTIDWNRSVRLEVDGRVVFKGRVERDGRVALARAAATMDFDVAPFRRYQGGPNRRGVDGDGRVDAIAHLAKRRTDCRGPGGEQRLPFGRTPPSAPNSTEVLGRAGDTVAGQVRESTTMLAEEQCRQSAYETVSAQFAGTLGGRVRTADRRWKADLAVVLVETPERVRPVVPWLEIRDVLEVDGRPLPRPRGAAREPVRRGTAAREVARPRDHRGEHPLQPRARQPDRQRARRPAAGAVSAESRAVRVHEDRRTDHRRGADVEDRLPRSDASDAREGRGRIRHAVARDVLDRTARGSGGPCRCSTAATRRKPA